MMTDYELTAIEAKARAACNAILSAKSEDKRIEAVEAVRQCVSALIDDISNSKPRTIAEWVERGEMPRTAND